MPLADTLLHLLLMRERASERASERERRGGGEGVDGRKGREKCVSESVPPPKKKIEKDAKEDRRRHTGKIRIGNIRIVYPYKEREVKTRNEERES